MIFVTVGTHEQQFNRLIEEIDRLKGNGIIKDEVIMQTVTVLMSQNTVNGQNYFHMIKC